MRASQERRALCMSDKLGTVRPDLHIHCSLSFSTNQQKEVPSEENTQKVRPRMGGVWYPRILRRAILVSEVLRQVYPGIFVQRSYIRGENGHSRTHAGQRTPRRGWRHSQRETAKMHRARAMAIHLWGDVKRRRPLKHRHRGTGRKKAMARY